MVRAVLRAAHAVHLTANYFLSSLPARLDFLSISYIMKTKSKALRIHDQGGRKMKYAKKPMALVLSLVLCMVSACGNDPPKRRPIRLKAW